ncbi:MAG: DUF2007 domain-containing protein [Prevotellaceae bacterium]|jgi:hypothetical protein|nr:DUF2007 domain-containing protein [Prevotellaceae bacterium]
MEDRIINIKSYENLYDAGYARDFLKENGIEAFVSGENTAQLYPVFSSSFGVRLNIFARDKERAEELLNDLDTTN